MRSVAQELADLGAPPKLREAGEVVDKYRSAKLSPPKDIVDYIRSWVGQHNTQDRYGQ